MSHNSSTTNTGVSLMGLLAVLFIGLKLTDNIDWSWWLVLAPLWGPSALALVILGLVFLFELIRLSVKK